MQKTLIKILRTVIVPYASLAILLCISFFIAEVIAHKAIIEIIRTFSTFNYPVQIVFNSVSGMVMLVVMQSVTTLLLTLLLGIGAIKFIDKYNQDK